MVQKDIDQTKILTQKEIVQVLSDLRRKGRRAINQRQNLVIFRLATCCGLRVSEIVGLSMANVITGSKKPHIYIPKEIAKRNQARRVPLWWDASTLADLENWRKERLSQGAKAGSPFVCAQQVDKLGKQLVVLNAQHRFKLCIKCLGPERVKMLSIHKGRHSFCSHALNGGRNLQEVRDAAGHANISTTSIYLHSIHNEDEEIGNLFDFS
jgi:integrase/recombinase XerD